MTNAVATLTTLLAVLVFGSARAMGDFVNILSSYRAANARVILEVPGFPQDIDIDSEALQNAVGPYSAAANAHLLIGNRDARASASIDSDIQSTPAQALFSAVGSAQGDFDGLQGGESARAYATSSFVIDFEVTAPTLFEFTGSLSATGYFEDQRIRATLFSHTIHDYVFSYFAPVSGASQSGSLSPGLYFFSTIGDSYAREGNVTYDVQLAQVTH